MESSATRRLNPRCGYPSTAARLATTSACLSVFVWHLAATFTGQIDFIARVRESSCLRVDDLASRRAGSQCTRSRLRDSRTGVLGPLASAVSRGFQRGRPSGKVEDHGSNPSRGESIRCTRGEGVAGHGFEPWIYGLWARRADLTTLPRCRERPAHPRYLKLRDVANRGRLFEKERSKSICARAHARSRTHGNPEGWTQDSFRNSCPFPDSPPAQFYEGAHAREGRASTTGAALRGPRRGKLGVGPVASSGESRGRESNPRPAPYQGAALPTEPPRHSKRDGRSLTG